MYIKPFLTYFVEKRITTTQSVKCTYDSEKKYNVFEKEDSILQCGTRTFTKVYHESSDSDMHYDLFYHNIFNN